MTDCGRLTTLMTMIDLTTHSHSRDWLCFLFVLPRMMPPLAASVAVMSFQALAAAEGLPLFEIFERWCFGCCCCRSIHSSWSSQLQSSHYSVLIALQCSRRIPLLSLSPILCLRVCESPSGSNVRGLLPLQGRYCCGAPCPCPCPCCCCFSSVKRCWTVVSQWAIASLC